MKKLLFVLAAIIFFNNFITSKAEDASSAKANQFEVKQFAIVDIKHVMDESEAAKSVRKEIDTLRQKFLDEVKETNKKLAARDKELASQKKVLSADAFKKKVDEFKSRIEKEKESSNKKQKVMETAFMKALEAVKAETLKTVAEIAKEKNIDMVVPSSQLLYAKNTADITLLVIERLNKKITKVDINIKDDTGDKKAK
jgi:Skp family chaperone for outer membrane proteins